MNILLDLESVSATITNDSLVRFPYLTAPQIILRLRERQPTQRAPDTRDSHRHIELVTVFRDTAKIRLSRFSPASRRAASS